MARRKQSEYDWSKLEFDETILTKHFNEDRGGAITFVVVHHMATLGDGKGKALDACFDIWQDRKASAHYGVDGMNVRQFVWDSNGAWHTGTDTGNIHGIGIEHANASLAPHWRVDEDTWKTGAKLAAHIRLVHDLGRPVKNETLRKHSSFKATACPGPFIDAKWNAYVDEAQRVYDALKKRSTGTDEMRAPNKDDPVPVRLTRGRRVDQAIELLKESPHTGVNRQHVQDAIAELMKIKEFKA